tara:strand:+ start:1621 stop:1800 length:180 start_codon:yes stop_codon:yes gene_type:complete
MSFDGSSTLKDSSISGKSTAALEERATLSTIFFCLSLISRGTDLADRPRAILELSGEHE